MPDPDLGPKPDAEIDPGEPNPGGVDAVPQSDGVDTELAEPDPVGRDLDPDDNPAVEDVLPDELATGEDTSTQATESGEDGTDVDVDPEKESPA